MAIVREMRALLVSSSVQSDIRCIPMRLSYDPDEPYTIVMLIHGNDSAWMFSRDMLVDGLHGHVGYGDVRIWPSELDENDIMFALSSQDGYASFSIKRTTIMRFLTRTFTLVPFGAESDYIKIGDTISGLGFHS